MNLALNCSFYLKNCIREMGKNSIKLNGKKDEMRWDEMRWDEMRGDEMRCKVEKREKNSQNWQMLICKTVFG